MTKKQKAGKRVNNGGARPGAGRPKVAERKRKIPITVYIDPETIRTEKKKKAAKELILSTLGVVRKNSLKKIE